MQVVPGTPRWAVVAAWLTFASVLPSGLWRTLVGFGVPLGWSQAHLDAEQIPGSGTAYVLFLTVASATAAALTLGLVQEWGDRFPTWLVVTLAGLGALAVAYLVVGSIVNWSHVSGFADRPTSGWALLMIACYAPAALWAPLLVAVTIAFVRRRQAFPPQTGQAP